MEYRIAFMPEAKDDYDFWVSSGQKRIVKKINTLLDELKVHPTTGTGRPERLRGDLQGSWSRRIDKGARMVYTIEDDIVIVTVVSLRGHYGDK